jgi:steroid delta-isomerase-like uncharacterized protein
MDREAILARAGEITAAWNRGDAAAVAAFAREDVALRDISGPEPVRGRAAIQAAAQAYMTAFPDLHIEDTSNLCDGDRLSQEWVATGTHDGPLMQFEPTHRSVRVEGCTVAEFDAEGLMATSTMYWNPMTLLAQIGALPEPAAAHA